MKGVVSAALLLVTLLPVTRAVERKIVLTNEERTEYTRNGLVANNRHVNGGWQPVAEPATTNRFYPVNTVPRKQTAYVKLPLGCRHEPQAAAGLISYGCARLRVTERPTLSP